jgi:hypothetical protein
MAIPIVIKKHTFEIEIIFFICVYAWPAARQSDLYNPAVNTGDIYIIKADPGIYYGLATYYESETSC